MAMLNNQMVKCLVSGSRLIFPNTPLISEAPTIRQLKQISMPGAVHPVVIGEISRCQDWIAIVGKEGASDFLA